MVVVVVVDGDDGDVYSAPNRPIVASLFSTGRFRSSELACNRERPGKPSGVLYDRPGARTATPGRGSRRAGGFLSISRDAALARRSFMRPHMAIILRLHPGLLFVSSRERSDRRRKILSWIARLINCFQRSFQRDMITNGRE